VKIELTPFQQRQSYTPKDRGRLCVAACLRTVLAALSTQYSEDDLARACNTDPSGTTLADAAIAVRSLGFNALFIPETTFEMLTDWLQRGVPMIVGLAADELDHGAVGGYVVVVCGIEAGQVIVVDPAIGAERRLELEMFLRAWRRLRNRGLVVLCSGEGKEVRIERIGSCLQYFGFANHLTFLFLIVYPIGADSLFYKGMMIWRTNSRNTRYTYGSKDESQFGCFGPCCQAHRKCANHKKRSNVPHQPAFEEGQPLPSPLAGGAAGKGSKLLPRCISLVYPHDNRLLKFRKQPEVFDAVPGI
jgi:hypothetical protein